jgi:predicted O-linked N-acetylglucosamine transferase (SPINDLY family)
MYQEGRLSEAERLFLKLRGLAPSNGDVLHLLGLVAYQSGRHEEALSYLRDGARLMGRSPHVMNSLGVVLLELGKDQEAIEAFGRAIELKADFSQAYNNLGNALRRVGRLDEAVEAYGRSLRIKPGDAEVLNNLANALTDQGKIDDAIAAYRDALAANPSYAPAYRNMGNALRDRGSTEEAIGAYSRAIALKADFVEAHNDLGNALKNRGHLAEAVREYEAAIALRPEYPEAYCNLGNVYREKGLTEKAIDCYHTALRIRPHFAETMSNLGNALKDQGRLDEALGAYQEALALKPGLADTHSNLIYARQFIPGITLKDILEDHLKWNRAHVSPLRSERFSSPSGRGSSGRMVLGFVSGDFRRHPVGSFLITVLESLSSKDCEIICYANQTENDDMTERFRKAAHVWKSCHHLSDEALAGSIRQDAVDILFDLSGHNERNRLLVFARKPAPLQVSWAGYMATTGLETIDYIIADQHEIPEGSERYYTEKVIRMPHSFVCYDPPEYAPPVLPLPAFANGYVTFGCFNILSKISPEVASMWSTILHQVAGSRLILKTKELNSEEARGRYANLFLRQGIASDRVDLIGGTPHREHLDYYNRIDVALDPFPFSGSTTTLESLWMGIPVITMPGETFASRHSLSFLFTVGLTETIAGSPDHYVALARELARDLRHLSEIRSSLRDRFRTSPLCDGEAFARTLLAILERLWIKR